MYSEQCKTCIVEGCPDSCSVKINYKRDFERVIRCKDCKHWYSDADTGMACEFTNMGQPEDGYCNWAERRSDE